MAPGHGRFAGRGGLTAAAAGVAPGSSGVLAKALSRGLRTPNWSIAKFLKPNFKAGEPSRHAIVALGRIDELRIARQAVPIAAEPLRRLERVAIGEQIVVDEAGPNRRHPYRRVEAGEDVADEHVLAVFEPNMRVEAVVDHDVVLDGAVEPFAVFDAAARQRLL